MKSMCPKFWLVILIVVKKKIMIVNQIKLYILNI